MTRSPQPLTVATHEPWETSAPARRAWPLGSRATLSLTLLLVSLIVVGVISYDALQDIRARVSWVAHTHEVMGAAGRLLSDLQDAENGERGYLLTGNKSSLEPYEAGVSQYRQEFALLEQLTRGDALEQARLRALAPVIDTKLAWLSGTLATYSRGDHEGAIARVRAGDGRRAMDEIRRWIAEIEATERQLLSARYQAAQSSYATTLGTVAASIVFALSLALLFAQAARRDLLKREQLEGQRARAFEERERAHAALHRSTALLRAVSEATPEAIYVKDCDTRLLFANPPAVRMLHAAAAATDLIGKTNAEILRDPEQARAITESEQRIMRSGVAETVEEVLHDPQGQRHFLSIKAPLRNEADAIVGVVCISHDITERTNAAASQRAAQETIERQLSEIELLYRTAPVGLTVFDRDLRCVRINEKMTEINGVPREASLGKQLREYIPGEFADGAEPILRRVLETGIHVNDVEVSGVTATGVRAHWLVGYHPWTSGVGQVIGVNVVVQDITERKKHELALLESEGRLRESEAQLELVSNTTPALLFHLDERRRYTSVNDAFLKWFGAQREEVIGLTVREFAGDVAWAMMEPHLGRAYAGEVTEYEAEVPYRLGGTRWIHPVYTPHRDASGKLAGVVVLITDITASKRAEAALAARTDELRQTFNATATGLTRCSRDLRYLTANPAYAQIAGVSLQQIVGRDIVEVMGQEGFKSIRPYIERVLSGESVEYEMPVPFSASGGRQLHVAYTPWRESDGSVSGWIASVTDVTARQLAEEKLKAANRQKDEFLAMLAHELRNPLAPIRNASEILTRTLGSQPQAQGPLAILQRQTYQLSRLVDDLLDVSRIAEGQVNLKQDVIEIGAVLDQAVETIQPLVEEKLHRLSIHKPLSPVYVRGDLARLVQSLGNVLHNAAKYTDAGGAIDVRISESDGELGIAIRDSGSGIPSELLPHVFDLFVQSPRTLDRSQGGLGIGLTVVKQLIEMHGGTVTAESEGQGCGSTFTLRLPSAGPPRARHSAPEERSALRRRILVVDDNVDAAESLAVLLRFEGHEVSTAFGASEALEAVERLKPEVLLLDIGLPQMDGYEVARRLRMRHGGACPYLVALTGYGQTDDLARAIAAGFAAHLTKPVDSQRLRMVLSADLEVGVPERANKRA